MYIGPGVSKVVANCHLIVSEVCTSKQPLEATHPVFIVEGVNWC